MGEFFARNAGDSHVDHWLLGRQQQSAPVGFPEGQPSRDIVGHHYSVLKE
jgi:hypothetical protein